jgi:hypothetical protein
MMDIKEIIEMAIEADLLHIPKGHEDLPLQNPTFNTMLKLQKFAELTLKRASEKLPKIDVDLVASVVSDYSNSEMMQLQANLSQAEAEKAELASAAKAVVDRWHTPAWKDAPHTAEFINRLENALKDKT